MYGKALRSAETYFLYDSATGFLKKENFSFTRPRNDICFEQNINTRIKK